MFLRLVSLVVSSILITATIGCHSAPAVGDSTTPGELAEIMPPSVTAAPGQLWFFPDGEPPELVLEAPQSFSVRQSECFDIRNSKSKSSELSGSVQFWSIGSLRSGLRASRFSRREESVSARCVMSRNIDINQIDWWAIKISDPGYYIELERILESEDKRYEVVSSLFDAEWFEIISNSEEEADRSFEVDAGRVGVALTDKDAASDKSLRTSGSRGESSRRQFAWTFADHKRLRQALRSARTRISARRTDYTIFSIESPSYSKYMINNANGKVASKLSGVKRINVGSGRDAQAGESASELLSRIQRLIYERQSNSSLEEMAKRACGVLEYEVVEADLIALTSVVSPEDDPDRIVLRIAIIVNTGAAPIVYLAEVQESLADQTVGVAPTREDTASDEARRDAFTTANIKLHLKVLKGDASFTDQSFIKMTIEGIGDASDAQKVQRILEEHQSIIHCWRLKKPETGSFEFLCEVSSTAVSYEAYVMKVFNG